jgi:hypothetical protein
MKRNFKGVWIPAQLYLNEGITWTQKLMLVEIDSFSKSNLPCFISNEHLAQHLQISESGVEKALRGLVKLGMVDRRRESFGQGTRRILRVATSLEYGEQPHSTEVSDLTQVRHNNTRTNTTTKPMKEGKPSSEGECLEYFIELGLDEQEAAKFWDWYEQTGWKLKGGNSIKDWKATARNWQRRTNTHKNENRNNKSRGFNSGNFDNHALERYVTEG